MSEDKVLRITFSGRHYEKDKKECMDKLLLEFNKKTGNDFVGEVEERSSGGYHSLFIRYKQ